MRDLTKEELALAPDWATHYSLFIHDVVIYQSDEFWWWSGIDSDGQPGKLINHTEVDFGAKPIPRKPFDITNHNFGDSVQHVELCGFELTLYCVDGYRHVEIYKEDAIAIAKALGVAAEDLK